MFTWMAKRTKQKTDMFVLRRDANTMALRNDILVDIMGLQLAKSDAMAYSWKSVLARLRPKEIAQMESDAVDLVNDFSTGDNIKRMKRRMIEDFTFDLSAGELNRYNEAVDEISSTSGFCTGCRLPWESQTMKPKVVTILEYTTGVTGFQF